MTSKAWSARYESWLVKEYALYLESGPRRRKTMVHVLELLGCIAQGPTTEKALAATPEAIRAYLRFALSPLVGQTPETLAAWHREFMASRIAPITTAEPRSPWARLSPAATAAISASGSIVRRRSHSSWRRRTSRSAAPARATAV